MVCFIDNSPMMPDQPVVRQDGAGVITRDESKLAYEFDECANLARLVPNDAINNADNYQIFATVSCPRSIMATLLLNTSAGYLAKRMGLGQC